MVLMPLGEIRAIEEINTETLGILDSYSYSRPHSLSHLHINLQFLKTNKT
jgi:hypothetical protein